MDDERSTCVARVARQLLIRDDEVWSSLEARRAVGTGLAAIGVTLPRPIFHALGVAAFRVGGCLVPIRRLPRKVPWPVETITSRLRDCFDWDGPDEPAEAFLARVADQLRSLGPRRSWSNDWDGLILRGLALTGAWSMLDTLEERLWFAEVLRGMMAERVDALVAFVEREQDVRVADVEAAIATAWDEAEATASGPITPTPRRRPERPTDKALESLLSVVDVRRRTEFRAWFARLDPRSQRATEQRLGRLEAEPLLARLWTKPIVGTRHGPLVELRIVAEGTHLRVLMTRDADRGPCVLSFGLRRDLHELVAHADRLLGES